MVLGEKSESGADGATLIGIHGVFIECEHRGIPRGSFSGRAQSDHTAASQVK
jgi:hypothetical protein